VSKIESGKVVLSVEEFTLNDMISSVDAMIRPMAVARGQSFYVEVSDVKHEYLMGDVTRINQILINLLSNAVKYTQEGGKIWLRMIGLKQRSSQYEHIRIEVEDNGYGMTPEYLKTIFDAFTRAENSTTNKVQGTGLGMAITKNIVELMGGTIDVSSQIGKGSLFKVDLEFRIPEGQMDRKFWENSRIARILAVEHDEEVCKNIQTLMQDTGVPVDIARSEAEALKQIHERSGKEGYHMLLIDWEQPDTEAAGTAERLRAALPEPVPVLFLADSGAVGAEEALPLEHAGVLTKPFFVSALKEKLIEMQAERTAEAKTEAVGSENLQGLHFLAAEDNEINAEILSEILAMEGADCEIVENGQLAVERFAKAREGEFDAILMDVQMPVMNGYDATRAIRGLERRDAGEVPIIAMTANAFAEDEKEALDAGMNVHLAKPIDIVLLKRIIKQYVKKG